MSDGDRTKVEESDSLLSFSVEDEGVTITQEGYNQTQKFLRLMENDFGDQEVDVEMVKSLVEDVRGLLKTIGVPLGRFAPPRKGGK